MLKINLNCLKSSKILPTDGARAWRPIGLDRRQIGLVREEGQIVEYENMEERVVTFKNWLSYIRKEKYSPAPTTTTITTVVYAQGPPLDSETGVDWRALVKN